MMRSLHSTSFVGKPAVDFAASSSRVTLCVDRNALHGVSA
jgi:hypothetical protein